MNIFAKSCCIIFWPYWLSIVFPMQVMAETYHEIASGSRGIPNVQDVSDLPEVPDVSDPVSVFWFEQKLDHFLSTETSTWKQKYYVNYKYYIGRGPVFLIIGGIAGIEDSDIRDGAWIEYAEEIGAMIFYLEHRFYGQSHPTRDLNTKNLVYLNSEQALGDLAWFTVSMQRKFQSIFPSTTKWIAFGTSFGGTLAARMRLKYPHLIHAAVTSSSSFLEKANFHEYFEFVQNEFDKYPGVSYGINKAYRMILTQINNNETVELADKLNMCTFLETHDRKKNISYLFWNLSNSLAILVEYGYNDLAQLKAVFLEMMVDGSITNALDRFAYAIQRILKLYNAECLSVDYDQAILAYKETSWTAGLPMDFTLSGGLGNRQNLYQRCTEFGQFETSDQGSGLFGHYFPVEFYVGICTDVFGEEFDFRRLSEGIKRTTMLYGGLDIEVSRVLFVNGGRDPWHYLGILESNTNDRIAVFNENASQSDDTRSGDELPALSNTRSLIFDILLQWLRN